MWISNPASRFLEMDMNVRDILKDWLVIQGYDGLYYDEYECGCSVDDLVPCDESPLYCEPAYRQTNDGFGPDKPNDDQSGDKQCLNGT